MLVLVVVAISTICLLRYTRKPRMKTKSTQTRSVTVCKYTQTLERDDEMSIEDDVSFYEINDFFFCSTYSLTSFKTSLLDLCEGSKE